MNDVSIKKAQRDFSVHRDDSGVPHIKADTWLDALYGLGYMHALDRGTQLLFSRTVACGQATGRIANKPELLETDTFFRRIGLHLGLQEEARSLDDATLDQVLVYCTGVNDGIEARGPSLPMRATRFQPDHWDAKAVILVGRLLSFGGLAVSQLQNERLLVELIHAGASDSALAEMFEPRLDELDFDLIRKVKISNKMSDEALELLVDLPRLAGSNAWAVAPSRSATGHALLAADPHLEINRLPAIWYEASLRWGRDEYCMGATLPGCPLFSVARTKPLAWGVTYLKGDTIDFFVEECRQHQGHWQYRRESDWLNFDVREESIQRKGEDEPESVSVLENEVGTLETTPTEDGFYLSTAWIGRQVSSAKAIATWLDLIHSESVTHAMDVIAECTQPTLCFVLADNDGHIGLQGCGSIPRRANPHGGLVPVPAWDPKNHWLGVLDNSHLPSVYDPPEGFVATANEENNPDDGPMIVTQTVHDYRLRRIQERLRELDQATIDDMKSIQYDVVSMQARDTLSIVLPLLEPGKLKSTLEEWDCSYGPDSTIAPIFQRLYSNVMMELFGTDKGLGWRRMVYLCSRGGFSSMILTAADRLLAKDDSWWWHGRDKAHFVRQAASRVEWNDPATTWSEVNFFHFSNRFFGGHRVGRLLGYDSRQHAMRGCHATPFQGHVFHTATRESTFAPSYHFVTDLGVDQAWTNLPGGPSESRFSKFYRSDVPLWLDAEYKSLQP